MEDDLMAKGMGSELHLNNGLGDYVLVLDDVPKKKGPDYLGLGLVDL
jgi:hypothetical protein